MEAVDLRACADERFVSLGEGFVTFSGFVEAFRVAQFTPNVVVKVGDIFSLMNLVSGGVGFTLLPGRVRDVFKDKVQLIPLQPQYLMRRLLRSLAKGEAITQDISTLENPAILEQLAQPS